ncbi:MAG TPA: FUSC family protein [Caulobacteraceae bacterium]|nr:FUSC family protein [Caulobacteraceae bacterium]
MRKWASQLLFSVNCLAAATLALYLAFQIGLPRPYWAVATVYIVSQPLSGAMRSKAVYRLIGTLAGGVAAILIVPTTATEPWLLSITMATWVAFCLFVSLLDRTPRSYLFILAGYTAAIIGFTSATEPEEIFPTAVARMEEISLGVVCATAIQTLVLPRPIGPVIEQRIEAWLREAEAWIVDAIAGLDSPDRQAARRQLATEATDIRILSTHLPFDTSNLRDTVQTMQALQDKMTFLTPIIPTLADRLIVLRAEAPLPDPIAADLDRVRSWILREEAPEDEAARLIAGLRSNAPAIDETVSWRDIVLNNLIDRVNLIVQTLDEIRQLQRAVKTGGRRLPRALEAEVRARRARPLHRDAFLGLLSAFAAFVAVVACCAAWIGLGWIEGTVAAMNAAVFCSFFASQDDPAPAIATFLWFTLLSIPVVAVYQFAILPSIDGFTLLAASLAPTLLVVGYFVGDPATSSRGIPVALGISNGLALAEIFSPDFAGFANTNIALVIGLLAALLITRLFRSVGADWSARRLLQGGWRELAHVAASPSGVDRPAFTIAMLDRAGLLIPRLAVAAPDPDAPAAETLQDLRIGLNLDTLQKARPALTSAGGSDALRRLLTGLERHYRTLAARVGADASGLRTIPGPPANLLGELDETISASTRAASANPEAHEALLALVSLRRSLFPMAPTWRNPGEAIG